MRCITDIHLHSKWSRACSKNLTIPNIAKACEQKGIDLVGTSDALHPAWRKEIEELLEDAGEGTFVLKDGSSKTHFLLSTEISCIYSRAGRVRRVHHIALFPTLKALDGFISALTTRGCNLKSDGRPIIGLDSEELLKILLEVDETCLLIPAHAWTPWFSVFGSKSGFDAISECFGSLSNHIYAIETGLSSNPLMNRRISQLDSLFLLSNSDAHSCENIGREATVFEMPRPSYTELYRILSTHDAKKCIETIEFFPEEGKYFADGHALCQFWCDPAQAKQLGGVCPKCHKQLTIGVLHRVHELADRSVENAEKNSTNFFRSIIPLAELISIVIGKNKKTKAVEKILASIYESHMSEFAILLDASLQELKRIAPENIAHAIIAVRSGKVDARPGYDGVFGTFKIKV